MVEIGEIGAIIGTCSALAEKGVGEIIKTASKIYETIKGSYKVLNQEIVVLCPESVQHFSIAFEATGGFLSQKIKFPFGKPLRVRLRPLRSLQDLSEAIFLTEEGFEINTRGMQAEDTFLLDVDYRITDPKFVDALVQRNHARELPKDRESEYWMHAQLKHPKVFQTKYGRLDLRDVDFSVNVGISEDIKMSIPSAFRRELEAGVKLLMERDPHRKYMLGREHVKAMRARGKGKSVIELLGDLQDLFFPRTFRKFVEVKKDFRYSECHRGSDFYETVPFPTWPKTMKVISRTDLGLERYAAEGILVYKKADFLEQVSKILGVKLK
ncbi:hypothetical protein [Candidatus Hecatella orcuttiae]|jgi:hypothetical protein|uniref:hypothetical protein n=1 Tax=Candidatus Hecatella orcuttiae TaxID=1935119 RepID=UPI002867E3B7|nr:hypothetical protein [Candidatus Hecatella orcuttiae]